MSRTYRFLRVDAGAEAASEVTLRCPTDEDALLVAERIGQRVEVWQDERRVGVVVGEVETAAAELAPQGHRPSASRRAFNPFLPDAWRRVRREP
jgi:hypothetical protein